MKHESIVICEKCEGSGKIEHSERYDYHHGYDWVWDEPCSVCGGYGRLMKTVTTVFRKLTEEDLKLTPKPKEAE
jgi:DnaJ-class molecular chaperone